ncbi:MAG: restriction endonuclease [Terrimicrobiaceae bacterium]|nr:restriction endonuclease [Terrimicrobiaceae bacterium]
MVVALQTGIPVQDALGTMVGVAIWGLALAGLAVGAIWLFVILVRHESKMPDDPVVQSVSPVKTTSLSPKRSSSPGPIDWDEPLAPVLPDVGSALSELDWHQFERLTGALFRAGGCRVEQLGGGKADGGVDLIAEVDGNRCAVQCKQWKNWKCGVQTVRELLGTMVHEQIPFGYVVAMAFTGEAYALAGKHGIALVDRERLVEWIKDSLKDEEVRQALFDPPKQCPRCGGEMVIRTAKKGRNAGDKFWGCRRYPDCRGMMKL